MADLTGADHLRACTHKDCERCTFLLSEYYSACDGPCGDLVRKDEPSGSYDPATGKLLCERCSALEPDHA